MLLAYWYIFTFPYRGLDGAPGDMYGGCRGLKRPQLINDENCEIPQPRHPREGGDPLIGLARWMNGSRIADFLNPALHRGDQSKHPTPVT